MIGYSFQRFQLRVSNSQEKLVDAKGTRFVGRFQENDAIQAFY